LVALAAGLLLAADSPKDDPAKKEAEGLQGKWVAEKTVISGKESGKNDQTTLVVEGESVSWKYTLLMGDTAKSSTIQFTFKLDPKKKPAEIDLIPTEGPFKGKAFPSIYLLDGDTLKLCRSQPGQPRPTEFASKEGSDHYLLILKRSKSE